MLLFLCLQVAEEEFSDLIQYLSSNDSNLDVGQLVKRVKWPPSPLADDFTAPVSSTWISPMRSTDRPEGDYKCRWIGCDFDGADSIAQLSYHIETTHCPKAAAFESKQRRCFWTGCDRKQTFSRRYFSIELAWIKRNPETVISTITYNIFTQVSANSSSTKTHWRKKFCLRCLRSSFRHYGAIDYSRTSPSRFGSSLNSYLL